MAEKISTSVSMVIPVYNEAALLKEALARCLGVLNRDFADFEIIVVDDGSTDGSYETALQEYATDPRVVLIKNEVNLNVGIAIQRGFKVAKKEYVLHNAVDVPLAPESLAGLITVALATDVLVIERLQYPHATVWRKSTSLINRMLLKCLFPGALRGIYDLNFTQIYKRAALAAVMPLAKSPSFTTPEMILRARYCGLRVQSVAAEYTGRTKGRGAFGKPHDMLWSLYDMIRFRIKRWRHHA